MQDLDAHAARIARDGYTIVEDAIEPELVDAPRRGPRCASSASSTIVPRATNSFEGTTRCASTTCSCTASSTSGSRCIPNVLPIVERVLDPGCLVSSLSSIAIGPGESAQPIHADDQLIPLPKPHVPTVCNTMWALTDFTEENGATRIIPGSHLRDHSPDYGQHYDSIPAEMPARQRARLARQPLARRRRQPHRRAAASASR